MSPILTAAAWELLFAPYDPATYQLVLNELTAGDVILDIGAGDMRFARMAASHVRKIYAVEQSPEIIAHVLTQELPANVEVICADACEWEFPSDITTGVLLMRHCQHYRHYAEKLLKCGASTLITNARWGIGVEIVYLSQQRVIYDHLPIGWFACWCGSTGFKPGPVELITADLDRIIFEVNECPDCAKNNFR
jgi:hypothetical protein